MVTFVGHVIIFMFTFPVDTLSVHTNIGVLVSWPLGRGQILCNYSPPHPPAIIHVYLHYVGEGEPCQPAPSPWIPAHTTQLQGDLLTPLTHNNTQQHTRTPYNRQQHTTTVHNSTRVHKLTNVPQFLKQRDINSYNHFWTNRSSKNRFYYYLQTKCIQMSYKQESLPVLLFALFLVELLVVSKGREQRNPGSGAYRAP